MVNHYCRGMSWCIAGLLAIGLSFAIVSDARAGGASAGPGLLGGSTGGAGFLSNASESAFSYLGNNPVVLDYVQLGAAATLYTTTLVGGVVLAVAAIYYAEPILLSAPTVTIGAAQLAADPALEAAIKTVDKLLDLNEYSREQLQDAEERLARDLSL